ncbi:MAG: FHA domain-containing protein [Verrucomicrobiae bacterium]|nr:FHA domain-containing protein [Verrucomicrobiae bacterium]
MPDEHGESTRPWSPGEVTTLQRRLIESGRVLRAFEDCLEVPCLLWTSGGGAGKETVQALPLEHPVVTVGRRGDPPLAFSEDRSMSNRHFRVLRGPNGVCYAEDLGSTNGLWINGRQVASRRLVHGDSIHAGNQDFVFHAGGATLAGLSRVEE